MEDGKIPKQGFLYCRLMALGANKQLSAANMRRKKQKRTWNFNRTRMPPTTYGGDDSRTLNTTLARPDPYPDHFKVRFDPSEYVVLENVGTMQLYVVRLMDKKKDVAG